jgi:threonine dehydrogenase-like Zn-dependent dehydrogenase
VVYDVTGHYAVLPMALKLAKDFGRVVLLGDTPHPSRQHLTQDVLARQVTIIGTHNVKLQPEYAWWTSSRQIRLFYQYVGRGQMRVADLITHRFQPEEAPQAYDMLQSDRGATLGVLFDWR